MFSIFTHVMKPVRVTNSEHGLPVVPREENLLRLEVLKIWQK